MIMRVDESDQLTDQPQAKVSDQPLPSFDKGLIRPRSHNTGTKLCR